MDGGNGIQDDGISLDAAPTLGETLSASEPKGHLDLPSN